MKETPQAVFNLENYKVKEFWYSDPKEEKSSVSLEFSPTGIYLQQEGRYILTLEMIVFYKDKEDTKDRIDTKFLRIITESFFVFQSKPTIEELPPYFYQNAIAIVFPYVRAFATTLTAVGNIKPLILPLMNLTSLGEILKANTA